MKKVYEKEDITLFQRDCIEILNKATPESVDMIFADPPYMLSNGGITCHAGKVVSVNKAKWDESKGLDRHKVQDKALQSFSARQYGLKAYRVPKEFQTFQVFRQEK